VEHLREAETIRRDGLEVEASSDIEEGVEKSWGIVEVEIVGGRELIR
jgi:hypothetical protein